MAYRSLPRAHTDPKECERRLSPKRQTPGTPSESDAPNDRIHRVNSLHYWLTSPRTHANYKRTLTTYPLRPTRQGPSPVQNLPPPIQVERISLELDEVEVEADDPLGDEALDAQHHIAHVADLFQFNYVVEVVVVGVDCYGYSGWMGGPWVVAFRSSSICVMVSRTTEPSSVICLISSSVQNLEGE